MKSKEMIARLGVVLWVLRGSFPLLAELLLLLLERQILVLLSVSLDCCCSSANYMSARRESPRANIATVASI